MTLEIPPVSFSEKADMGGVRISDVKCCILLSWYLTFTTAVWLLMHTFFSTLIMALSASLAVVVHCGGEEGRGVQQKVTTSKP